MLSTGEPARRGFVHTSSPGLPLPNHNLPVSKNCALHNHHAAAESPSRPSSQNTMQHIWIITGPAGCGKTTVAQGLARELVLPYIEGDDYHSKSNKEKMASNIPLTDTDRWDWLIQLREAAITCLSSNNAPAGVVVACSALKHKYRDVIRVAAYNFPSVQIHFIYLRADESVLLQRVKQRKGHYMKSTMVHSQFEMLEEPDAEWDALSVDCTATPAEVEGRVLSVVYEKLAEYK